MPVLKIKISVLLFLVIFIAGVCPAKPPKYIFLMIGDGMGQSQRQIANLYRQAKGKQKLQMDLLPVKGSIATNNSAGSITDSAAAGTALATGHKTLNGIICMNADKSQKFESVAFKARKNGMKIGIVTSTPLNHATPASFYAHAEKRNNYIAIANQLPLSGFDFFAGQKFINAKQFPEENNPYTEAEKRSYKLICSANKFNQLDKNSGKVIIELPMPFAIEAKTENISLHDLTAKCIEMLENNPQGFFIMVEGGKIDWCCHANDFATAVHQVIYFDKAIEAVYKFYLQHPEETLIVITADHETGGLGINEKKFPAVTERFVFAVENQQITANSLNVKIKEMVNSEKSTDEMVSVITELMGYGQLNENEKEFLVDAIELSKKTDDGSVTATDPKIIAMQKMYGTKNIVVNACMKFGAERCGISWKSRGHTGQDVPVSAIGNGADIFAGSYDNTDICKKIESLIHCVPMKKQEVTP